MTLEKSEKEEMENIFAGIAFAFFFAMGLFKLSQTGLWFDETVEFYYSKIMSGHLPWPVGMGSGTQNMYQRITSTYQPPLYNFLMHFWLKIREGEWWFRFFGVLSGTFGAAGIFKSIEFFTKSKSRASLAVVFYAILPRQVFYIQEASEYCLLLAFLPWAIFFFARVSQNPAKRDILFFAIFCVLSVYSQYGAAFPVAAMLIFTAIRILRQKDSSILKFAAIVYAACFVFAAIPLWHFFIRIQIRQQASQPDYAGSILFSINNLIQSPVRISKYLLLPNAFIRESIQKIIFSAIFLLCVAFSVICCVKNRDKKLTYFFLALYATYLLFCVAIKFHKYSYGTFTPNRYKLFLLPQFFIFAFLSTDSILKKIKSLRFPKNALNFARGIFIFCVCVFSLENFCVTQKNWGKQDIRGAVKVWREKKLYKKPTLLYPSASSGFFYYITHGNDFDDDPLKNVVFQKSGKNIDPEKLQDELKNIFGENIPKEFCFIASHIDENYYRNLREAFKKNGCEVKEHFTRGAKLLEAKY